MTETVILRVVGEDPVELAGVLERAAAAGGFGEELTVRYVPAVKPRTGFGLTVPPEIVIAFGKGLAGALGSGAGKLLWDKIRDYFQSRNAKAELVVEAGGERRKLETDNLPASPPVMGDPSA